jgi:hypothetical protein
MAKHKIPLPNKEDLRLIGKYIAGLYRLNYFVVSGYVAANTFESIINKFLDSQGKLDFLCETQECLHKKIEKLDTFLLKKQLDISTSTDELILIKEIRNDIVHGFIRDVGKEKIEEIVQFIWEVIREDSYLSLNDIDLKTAQYWVRDFEVITSKEVTHSFKRDTKEIKKDDFYDLYTMRHKLLSFENYLHTEQCLGKYKNFKVDNVSAVNPTSAYVWLAIVESEIKSRKKIFGPSISILVTPLDLRVYLDFGGFAYDERLKYYKFLQKFNAKEINLDKKNLYIFDIDWYAFFGEKNKYEEYIVTAEMQEKAKKMQMEIKKVDKNVPLSWNKLLIGYIYERESLLDESLSFKYLWSKVENIIHLYKYFRQVSKDIDRPKPKYQYSHQHIKQVQKRKK